MSKLSSSLGFVVPAISTCKFLAYLTGIPDILIHDQQLISPLTSYFRLQEGLYLFQNGIDPYDGGSFHHSPLLLALFDTMIPTSRLVAYALWCLCDAFAALALVKIWRSRQRVAQSSRDALIASAYLLNPYLLLPSLALSTSTVDNALTLLSLSYACQGNASASLLLLALLVHMSPSSILILAPIILLLLSDPLSHLASPKLFPTGLDRAVPLLFTFIIYMGVLTVASCIAAGNLLWISRSWGSNLMLPDLTPNPGMWWYFFTEMFDHFRPFFLMVFSVHLLIYIAPICIKFQYDPLYAGFLLLGVLGTFKAYPTLADPGLFLSMIALFPEVYPYFRHPIVTALLHIHSALLLPLFNRLWLTQGTGNANFFYASTLVFACSNGAALIDCIWAGLRIAVGEAKEGDHVVQE
ncbi:PIG-U-domain-containing protein [Pleurotus eryngii]|uniref:PIG-U-domain-containing protein n=1 Tax=Pleurotus eryngii TaxID=5323 RepID=A0A9P6D5H6_PLEER|nr:PIG-U-domain-containing protein [Pleurotus eryngii]